MYFFEFFRESFFMFQNRGIWRRVSKVRGQLGGFGGEGFEGSKEEGEGGGVEWEITEESCWEKVIIREIERGER